MGHKPEMTKKRAAIYKRLAAERERQPAAPPMTDREAEAMAQQLWGDDGRAWHPCYAKAKDIRHCVVGVAIGDVRDEWQVYGHGADWASAFADAKNRGH